MKLKQKQVIESLLRVQAFLAANPAPAPVSYGPSKDMLDDVVGQLGDAFRLPPANAVLSR